MGNSLKVTVVDPQPKFVRSLDLRPGDLFCFDWPATMVFMRTDRDLNSTEAAIYLDSSGMLCRLREGDKVIRMAGALAVEPAK